MVTLTLALNKAKARNTRARPRSRPKASRPRPRPEVSRPRPRPENLIGLEAKGQGQGLTTLEGRGCST